MKKLICVTNLMPVMVGPFINQVILISESVLPLTGVQ